MCHLNKKEEEGHISSSDDIHTGNNNRHATEGPTTTIIGINRSADDFVIPGVGGRIEQTKAPIAVSGDNIYVARWSDNTENGNDEVMFRAYNDGGETFSDKLKQLQWR